MPKSSGLVAVICGLHYAPEVKSRQWMGRGEHGGRAGVAAVWSPGVHFSQGHVLLP